MGDELTIAYGASICMRLWLIAIIKCLITTACYTGAPPVLDVPTADWTSGQASHEYPSNSGSHLSHSLTSHCPSHHTRCADTHTKAGGTRL